MALTGRLAIMAALTAVSSAAAQSPARPVIAIMDFTNASLLDHATYEPLSVGVVGMLVGELRGNPAIQLVERQRLRQVLDEVKLGQTGEVDPATAAKAGKILGVRHMIFGSFIIDRKGTLRIDARSVNVQTSEVEHVETVTDDADNLLRAVQKLGQQLNRGLRLPGDAATSRPSEAARKGQVVADLKYARAIQEEDRKNPVKAAQFYREFLAETPVDYAPVQRKEAQERIKALSAGGSY